MTEVAGEFRRIELSTAWVELPGPAEEREAALDAIVERYADVADEPRGRLRRSLGIVAQIASELAPGAHSSFALILTPGSGLVEALLSIRVTRVTPDAYDNYLSAARALDGDTSTELIRRRVEEVALPEGRAILSSDFTLPIVREGIPSPATERTFLAIFPDGYETATEFTLLTQNLALIEDAGSYLLALAAGENPPFTTEGT